MERISVRWEGEWQEAEVLEPFRSGEVVARLQSGEEIVVPLPAGSVEDQVEALHAASRIFHIERLLADEENILEMPLPLN